MAMSQALEAEDKKDIPARDAFIRTAVSLAPEYKPLQAKVAMITRE
mgnify:CR=1 FL=1